MINGVNLFVLHTSVHQPFKKEGPGMTLGPFGQWFTRNETWAGQAKTWIDYLARSSYLLQQGHFAADLLYYYGQDSNVTALFGSNLPSIPEGHAFDFANADVLAKLSVSQGYLAAVSGMHYRLLVLDPRSRSMSLDVLKQLERLVAAGATVVGDKPLDTPSLADNANTFRVLADSLWGQRPARDQYYGKGRVLSGVSVEEALKIVQLAPDFSYSKSDKSTIGFLHRHLNDGELYFVSNQSGEAKKVEASFRLSGKIPELWHADTGSIEPVSFRQVDGRTVVPLSLDANQSLFVVFRASSQRRSLEVPQPVREVLRNISGPWLVRFQPDRGAPDRAVFPSLSSWAESPDRSIRFFSGTAAYEKVLEIPKEWLRTGKRSEIDLGKVKNVAEVLVNGKSAGVIWKQPYRFDVGSLLSAGSNVLTVRVTNLWSNRLIGDKQLGVTPIAFTTFNPYFADSPLLESGLFGPVKFIRLTDAFTVH
jgi:hypothetical protein